MKEIKFKHWCPTEKQETKFEDIRILPQDKMLSDVFEKDSMGGFLIPLLFTTNSDLEIYDGDVVDIGQTVNGQSEFIITAGKYGIQVHYNFDRQRSYEYSIEDFLKDDFDEIKVIGNIYYERTINNI